MGKADHKFRFEFAGYHGEWFSFRIPVGETERRNSRAALEFKNEVYEWLEDSNVDVRKRYLGHGCSDGYPGLPEALAAGNDLCLLLKDMRDVIRFDEAFGIEGVNPRVLLESTQGAQAKQ